MLTSTMRCLLRFPLMGCVNKNDKKVIKRIAKMDKKISKKYSKRIKTAKSKKNVQKAVVNGHLMVPVNTTLKRMCVIILNFALVLISYAAVAFKDVKYLRLLFKCSPHPRSSSWINEEE